MKIQTALARAYDLSNWIDSSIHGLETPSGDREAMAGALLDQVHEHHKAILLLLRNSFVGSAFSLVRPTLETFVRGVWLLRCASDKEVENFAKDKISEKSFGSLIKEIEARPGYDVGVLSKVKKEAWSAMCSYAHGGYLQAVRRVIPDQIPTNYTDGRDSGGNQFFNRYSATRCVGNLFNGATQGPARSGPRTNARCRSGLGVREGKGDILNFRPNLLLQTDAEYARLSRTLARRSASEPSGNGRN